jgi:hypothetical protein
MAPGPERRVRRAVTVEAEQRRRHAGLAARTRDDDLPVRHRQHLREHPEIAQRRGGLSLVAPGRVERSLRRVAGDAHVGGRSAFEPDAGDNQSPVGHDRARRRLEDRAEVGVLELLCECPRSREPHGHGLVAGRPGGRPGQQDPAVGLGEHSLHLVRRGDQFAAVAVRATRIESCVQVTVAVEAGDRARLRCRCLHLARHDDRAIGLECKRIRAVAASEVGGGDAVRAE